jgi:hypothetical protein
VRESTAWIRAFGHKSVTDVSSVHVVGTYGTASGLGVTRSSSEEVPQFIIRAFENAQIFRVVTPVVLQGTPDYILEGQVTAEWRMPWWTWVQFLDLAFHTGLFPTLGRSLEATAEIRMYDASYVLLRSWTFTYAKDYLGTVWWMMVNGGAYDLGSDVEFQNEVMAFALENVRADLAGAGNAVAAPPKSARGTPPPPTAVLAQQGAHRLR